MTTHKLQASWFLKQSIMEQQTRPQQWGIVHVKCRNFHLILIYSIVYTSPCCADAVSLSSTSRSSTEKVKSHLAHAALKAEIQIPPKSKVSASNCLCTPLNVVFPPFTVGDLLRAVASDNCQPLKSGRFLQLFLLHNNISTKITCPDDRLAD